MSVSLESNIIHLKGACRVEDAEPLLAMLQADEERSVDLTVAGHLHTAVVQILLAVRPKVRGVSSDPFIRSWIQPLLSQAQAGPAEILLPKGWIDPSCGVDVKMNFVRFRRKWTA